MYPVYMYITCRAISSFSTIEKFPPRPFPLFFFFFLISKAEKIRRWDESPQKREKNLEFSVNNSKCCRCYHGCHYYILALMTLDGLSARRNRNQEEFFPPWLLSRLQRMVVHSPWYTHDKYIYMDYPCFPLSQGEGRKMRIYREISKKGIKW